MNAGRAGLSRMAFREPECETRDTRRFGMRGHHFQQRVGRSTGMSRFGAVSPDQRGIAKLLARWERSLPAIAPKPPSLVRVSNLEPRTINARHSSPHHADTREAADGPSG